MEGGAWDGHDGGIASDWHERLVRSVRLLLRKVVPLVDVPRYPCDSENRDNILLRARCQSASVLGLRCGESWQGISSRARQNEIGVSCYVITATGLALGLSSPVAFLATSYYLRPRPLQSAPIPSHFLGDFLDWFSAVWTTWGAVRSPAYLLHTEAGAIWEKQTSRFLLPPVRRSRLCDHRIASSFEEKKNGNLNGG